MTKRVQTIAAVSQAHVINDPNRGPLKICVHYDPARTTPAKVRATAAQMGIQVGRQRSHAVVAAPQDASKKKLTQLRDAKGVLNVDQFDSGEVLVEFDPKLIDEARVLALLESKVASPGASGQNQSGKAHEHQHGGLFGERTELIFALGSGAALAAGWLLERAGVEMLPLAGFIIAYLLGGYFTTREAFDNLRHRQFRIDSLMLVAALGAAALGAWVEGALLLFLFSLGHALENWAMGRAKRAIEALGELAPDRAQLRRGDAVEDVAVADLKVGDIILVWPNERIPADGVVVAGASAVNQAPITGESAPVEKQAAASADAYPDFSKAPEQHRVFAGAINGAGALDVRVARLATESMLARIVTLVAEAESQRSPTQNFTEKFERIFVPCVLVLVGALLFAWVVIDEPFADSFYRAMAVLVAASPCALAISVPSAVLSGVARAARGGVLVKGGAALEALGRVSAIAFDKTGTLTEGKPYLTDVKPLTGVTEQELLSIAVAIERSSDHPLASAIVRDGATRLGEVAIPQAEAVESITGKGIQGRIDGAVVQIGKPGLFESGAAPMPNELRLIVSNLEASGRTVMVARRGARYLGVLGVMDTERASAKETVQRLRRLGIRRVVMLSGDNQRVADAVAASIGLDQAFGALMPDEKVAAINTLKAEAGGVAMIGDGVNDAPALANANVGVAMGAAGSDVALETADVALMADDLAHLPFAVGLSRQTTRIIQQNLWASLGVVALLIPSTIFGLQIGAAIIFHEGSTLLVVANALRLLAYRESAT
ncbi:MAG: heavy metal translocating P-type ATPase [Hyphomonadaceae bacterium]|nr:heavy metal translocating P-type ATPase [Hyphomonadaceae bacterium]